MQWVLQELTKTQSLGVNSCGPDVVLPLQSFVDIGELGVLLEDFLKEKNPEEACQLPVPVIELSDACFGELRSPKLILCHDMMGGYLEDAALGGGSSFHVYNFNLWHFIDTFIYFSHNCITLPPYGWIHAAHLHGVAVLGTIITEWDEGEVENRLLLQRYDTPIEFINPTTNHKHSFNFKSTLALVLLAKLMNFDGWFINIESKLEPSLVDDMQEFLRELTRAVKEILSSPRAQVLWYDSVIKSGELAWQNTLNKENECFFQNCDGIFTNYFWKDERLDECVVNSKDRLTDVYVGVDVFGRCIEQLGELQSFVPIAKALQRGLSAAVFAPGWTYEKNKEIEERESYIEAQKNLWAASPTEGIGMTIGRRKLYGSFPFYTTFNQGNGRALFSSGIQIATGDWNNMLSQDVQAYQYHNYKTLGENPNSKSVWSSSFDYSRAFEGGSSLKITVESPENQDCGIFDLFSFSPPIQDETATDFTIQFTVHSSESLITFLIIKNRESVYAIPSSDAINCQILRKLLGDEISVLPDSYHELVSGWTKTTCRIPAAPINYIGIAVCVSLDGNNCDSKISSLLGSISVFNERNDAIDLRNNVYIVQDEDNVKLFFNRQCTLGGFVDVFLSDSKKHIGRSYSDRLSISKKFISKETSLKVSFNFAGQQTHQTLIINNQQSN